MAKQFALFKRGKYYYVQFKLSDGSWSTNKSTRESTKGKAESWAIEYIESGKIELNQKISFKEVAQDFITKGFKAIITSVDGRFLDESFAGRIYDQSFLNDLPKNVDPCGENGEFHSFVFDGPIFSKPIPFNKGEVVYKEYKSHSKDGPKEDIGFWYCDLIP